MGIPLLVQPFLGTDQQALTYVLSTNQHRRNLTKTHRAVVGVEILAHLAPEVNARRIEKLKATLQRKRTGECSAILQNTPEIPGTKVSVARLAADIMGVSERYVADALRVKLTNQAIFEQMKTGKLSLRAALRLIEGTPDAEFARKSSAIRSRLAAVLRRAQEQPELLDQVAAFLDGLDRPPPANG